ncbi:MAG: type I CRISPR-associated protein Cas7, partial [Ruthenibacterium sp.]
SSKEDDPILRALRTLFENDASAARPEGSMEVCKLYWWQHNCAGGQYSSAKVHRALHVTLKNEAETPVCADDYELSLDELPGLHCEIIDGV